MVERCRFFNLTRMFQKDWIPGQVTPPNRYALRRGPQQPGMTQYLVGVVRFRACGADSLLRRYGKRRHTIADAFLSFAHIGSQQLEGGVHGLCVGAFIAVGGKDSGSDLLWPESLASQKSD